jgi:hypothetical protein
MGVTLFAASGILPARLGENREVLVSDLRIVRTPGKQVVLKSQATTELTPIHKAPGEIGPALSAYRQNMALTAPRTGRFVDVYI